VKTFDSYFENTNSVLEVFLFFRTYLEVSTFEKDF
jgi:hypothetical protein